MSCVLRVSGEFDPYPFLLDSPWEAEAVYRKGEAYLTDRIAQTSGFNILVSDAGFDAIEDRILDAIDFLVEYEAEFDRLRTLMKCSACLDFSMARYEGYVAWFVNFPTKLIELAGKCSLGLSFSLYATHHESEDEEHRVVEEPQIE